MPDTRDLTQPVPNSTGSWLVTSSSCNLKSNKAKERQESKVTRDEVRENLSKNRNGHEQEAQLRVSACKPLQTPLPHYLYLIHLIKRYPTAKT
ncbi:putative AAA domain-containing protein [Fusarium oxysporum f. sp. albedinis]|nr:putative AAA domain-containing protein [Fusarium oxysporum f. sp. albedinis]